MFLLASLVLGALSALAVGGRLDRVLTVTLRHSWTVLAALAVQVVLFTRLGAWIPDGARDVVHLGTYGLLLAFAAANRRVRPLALVFAGLGLNVLAIAANGGRMPVSSEAARAAGLALNPDSNVAASADRLAFLGDVFALPARLPFATAFSVGDVLIGLGVIGFVVVVSLGDGPERRLAPGRLVAPLADPTFRRVALGNLLSRIGDWLTLAALVGWTYADTRSMAQSTAVLVARLAPPILGGALAAALVDRMPRRRLLVLVELARASAVAVALVAVLAGLFPVVLAALAVSGFLATVSSVGVQAAVPALVPPAQLPAANAGLLVAQDAAMAVGALGAGLVLSTSGAALALVLDILTFAAAAALYLGIREPLPAAGERAARPRFVTGLRHLAASRRLLTVVVAFGIAVLAIGLTNATLPRLLGESLDLGAGGYGFGLAALATGLILGGVVVGVSPVGDDSRRWIGLGFAATALLLLVVGFVGHGPTVLLLLVLVGAADGATDVLYDTTVQREADPALHGSVFGVSASWTRTAMLASFAAAPLANGLTHPAGVIVIAGAILLVAGLAVLAPSIRAQPAPHAPARLRST